MRAAQVRMDAGTITPNEYRKQQLAYISAETAVKTSRLDLLGAQVEYDWAVNGLAGA